MKNYLLNNLSRESFEIDFDGFFEDKKIDLNKKKTWDFHWMSIWGSNMNWQSCLLDNQFSQSVLINNFISFVTQSIWPQFNYDRVG